MYYKSATKQLIYYVVSSYDRKNYSLPTIMHCMCVQCTCDSTLGTWQDRDETGNPSQKHDVELIKDSKR